MNPFFEVGAYTDKKYGVCLEWNYTDGRAAHIVEYIKNHLQNTDTVAFWRVWQTDYYEFEERPLVHRLNVSAQELSATHIKAIEQAEIWNKSDKMYPNRPSFYCLTVKR